jgi:hypothetical protein
VTEPAPSNDVDEHIAGVASLVEPQRRALYRLVALGVLDEQGYEPRPRGSEVTPRQPSVPRPRDQYRDLVCGMNHDQLSAMSAAVGDGVLAARLAPSEGSCCVRLDADQRAGTES